MAEATACIGSLAEYKTQEYRASPATLRIIEGVILVVLCLMTYAGNLLLWVTVLSFKDLHKAFFVLLLNLSLSDLLLAAVNMPLMAHALFAGRWIAGCTLCRISGCTFILGITTSTVTLLSVSFNRYVRVCREHWHHSLYSARRLPFHIAAIWVVSLSVSAVRGLRWNQLYYQPQVHYCYPGTSPLSGTLLVVAPNLLAWPVILLCTSSVYTQYKEVTLRAQILHLHSGKDSKRRRTVRKRLSLPPRLASIPEVAESQEATPGGSPRSVASGSEVENLESTTHSIVTKETATFYSLPFTQHAECGPDKASAAPQNQNANSTHKVLARRRHFLDIALALPFKVRRGQTAKGRVLAPSLVKKTNSSTQTVSRSSNRRLSPAEAKTADYHVSELLATMTVGSGLLFLPMTMIFLFEDLTSVPPFIHTLGLILLYLHSTCHPLIYWCTSPGLRERFSQQLCCSRLWRMSLSFSAESGEIF